MKDVVQTVARDAYAGNTKGIVVAVVLFVVLCFWVWWKEYVKRRDGD